MTRTENSTTQPIHPASLTEKMLVGAASGLLLISLFIMSAGKPDPGWGRYWMIRPLIIVPLAGAMGGLCNYFIFHFHRRFGVNKTVAALISVVVIVIGLWMGVVLGLHGTMWD